MVMQNKQTKMDPFYTLIQFLTSSTRFEPHGFIIRTTVCTSSLSILCFSCIYVSSPSVSRLCYDSV